MMSVCVYNKQVFMFQKAGMETILMNSIASTSTIHIHPLAVLLPVSALNKLVHLRVTYPMMFEILNSRTNKKTHVGVMEFSAEEGIAYVPYWIMQQLQLREVRNATKQNKAEAAGQCVVFVCYCASFLVLVHLLHPSAFLLLLLLVRFRLSAPRRARWRTSPTSRCPREPR